MKNRSIEITISNVVISKIQGGKRRDVCWIKRTSSQREREIVPVVFLVVLTIVITTSDPHFSRGITFPAGECKFQRRAGSGARGIQEDKLYRGERHIIYVASRIITVSTDRPRSV